MNPDETRAEIVAVARLLADSGLSPGRTGNISVRAEGAMLITPTGMRYSDIGPPDIVQIGLDGRVAPAQRDPSSEWRLHAAIYRARGDVKAVVHTHSLYATALACLGRSIPAFHYMIAKAGGDAIHCAPYATYGSEELALLAVAALGGRQACLLANHGAVAVGPTLGQARELAEELEVLAHQYVIALQIGQPNILDADEISKVVEKFATYGQGNSGL